MRFTRHIPLNGSYNIRDLGGYPTATGPTAWRRILRADSLHRLDDQAMQALHEMGCDTVIDLRRAEETTAQPNPFATAMPQVQYHNISLFEGLDPLITVDLPPCPDRTRGGIRHHPADHCTGGRRGFVSLHRRQGPHRHDCGAVVAVGRGHA